MILAEQLHGCIFLLIFKHCYGIAVYSNRRYPLKQLKDQGSFFIRAIYVPIIVRSKSNYVVYHQYGQYGAPLLQAHTKDHGENRIFKISPYFVPLPISHYELLLTQVSFVASFQCYLKPMTFVSI